MAFRYLELPIFFRFTSCLPGQVVALRTASSSLAGAASGAPPGGQSPRSPRRQGALRPGAARRGPQSRAGFSRPGLSRPAPSTAPIKRGRLRSAVQWRYRIVLLRGKQSPRLPSLLSLPSSSSDEC